MLCGVSRTIKPGIKLSGEMYNILAKYTIQRALKKKIDGDPPPRYGFFFKFKFFTLYSILGQNSANLDI